jgi:6-phosphogluconolactonase
MQFLEYPDRDLAALGVADKLASALRQALAHDERVSFAVPGGTTPGPIFDALSAVDLDWARVTVMLTDERWLPESHARSNAGLIRERLLQGHASTANFIPFYTDGQTAPAAAPVLLQKLSEHLPLSVLLLGMGADMHTASLFPGAQGLAEAMASDAPMLCAIDSDTQPETRITVSAPHLDQALDKHLVIFGDDKRAALDAAMSRRPEEAPIRAVIQGGYVHWAA